MRVLLLLCLFPALALADPKPIPVKQQEDTAPSRSALLATVDHIQQLARDQQANLDKEKQEHQKADASLEISAKALGETSLALIAVQKQVQAQTDKLNSTKDKLDAAAKALWWYRLHWWGAWIMLGLGILACIAFAFLKFTGRLAIAAAPIVAKIP